MSDIRNSNHNSELDDNVELRESKQCFVTRMLESRFPFPIKNKWIASVFKVNLIPNIIFGALLYFRWKSMTPSFIIAYISLFSSLNIFFVLIWHYDERFMPRFFREVFELVPDKEYLNENW